MKMQIKKEIRHTMVLNNNEAKWLKAMMQRPLYSETLENEDPKNKKMREAFLKGLSKIGVNIS